MRSERKRLTVQCSIDAPTLSCFDYDVRARILYLLQSINGGFNSMLYSKKLRHVLLSSEQQLRSHQEYFTPS